MCEPSEDNAMADKYSFEPSKTTSVKLAPASNEIHMPWYCVVATIVDPSADDAIPRQYFCPAPE